MTDRLDLGALLPRTSRWSGLVAAAQGWLRPVPGNDVAALSPHMRQDLGLGSAAADTTAVLNFEARRIAA